MRITARPHPASRVNELLGGRAKGLVNLLRRSLEERRIECMGYVEASDDDGFRFVRTW